MRLLTRGTPYLTEKSFFEEPKRATRFLYNHDLGMQNRCIAKPRKWHSDDFGLGSHVIQKKNAKRCYLYRRTRQHMAASRAFSPPHASPQGATARSRLPRWKLTLEDTDGRASTRKRRWFCCSDSDSSWTCHRDDPNNGREHTATNP